MDTARRGAVLDRWRPRRDVHRPRFRRTRCVATWHGERPAMGPFFLGLSTCLAESTDCPSLPEGAPGIAWQPRKSPAFRGPRVRNPGPAVRGTCLKLSAFE